MCKNKIILLLYIISIGVVFYSAPAFSFTVHEDYKVKTLKTLKGRYDEKITLELAYTDDREITRAGISRIQVRNEGGRIIAYTPTRITAIPTCFTRNACWVFLWKTVYPLPAIFKLNTDYEPSTINRNPPMQYSRNGPGFEGFDEKFNPLLGLMGLMLFFWRFAWFFCFCILLSIILALQISKYRDLPEKHKKWIRQALSLISIPLHVPLPVEPYMITSFVIMAWSAIGMNSFGIPLTHSALVVMGAFFMCCVRLGRLKELNGRN